MDVNLIEDKKAELIGKRFGLWHPATAAMLRRQWKVKDDKELAYYAHEFFNDYYKDYEKETKAELEAWIEDEEERMDMIDPPYRKDDPSDYLRREI